MPTHVEAGKYRRVEVVEVGTVFEEQRLVAVLKTQDARPQDRGRLKKLTTGKGGIRSVTGLFQQHPSHGQGLVRILSRDRTTPVIPRGGRTGLATAQARRRRLDQHLRLILGRASHLTEEGGGGSLVALGLQ